MSTLQYADPREFVQYVINAVNANPDLREPLLRALLTEEFLEMPGRVARIEEDVSVLKEDVSILKEDVNVLKEDVSVLKEDVNILKDDVGWLRGKAHETDFSRIATSLLNREFGFRRVRVVLGNVIAMPRHAEEFQEKVAEAADDRLITDDQLQRIFATDVIAHCRRSGETEPIWVAVEIAARVDEDDIERAVQSAVALSRVFGEETLPVVVGERIDAIDADRARRSNVTCITL